MKKPTSLRQHLLAANPSLKRDADKLAMYVQGGHIISTGCGSLSYEHAYTLVITVLDYAGPVESLIVPTLAWLRVNQSEILDNTNLRERAFRFEAEILNSETADITLQLDLSERIIVSAVQDPSRQDVAGRYVITGATEPIPPDLDHVQAEHWELWNRDSEKLADWNIPASAI